MGDWDYINDEMGGWDEDGLPNFLKCFTSSQSDKGYFYCNNYWDFQNFKAAVGFAANAASPLTEDQQPEDWLDGNIILGESGVWKDIYDILLDVTYAGKEKFIYISPADNCFLVLCAGKGRWVDRGLEPIEYIDKKKVKKIPPSYESVLKKLKEILCGETILPEVNQEFLKQLNKEDFMKLAENKGLVDTRKAELNELIKNNASSEDLQNKVLEMIKVDCLMECNYSNRITEYDPSKVEFYVEFKDDNGLVEFKVEDEDKEFHLYTASEDGSYSKKISNRHFLKKLATLENGHFIYRPR